MNSNHNLLNHYILGTSKLGSGIGAVVIVVHLISGSVFLNTPEAILKIGVFGGIGYGLAGFLAMIFFAKFGLLIRTKYPTKSTLGDLISIKLNPFGYNLLIIILILISLFTLILEGAIATLIFDLINFPVFIGSFLLISFCVLYAGIGGIIWIQRIALIQIFFIFLAVIILPLFFFFQLGIEDIYNNIRLFHPYLLVFLKDTPLYIAIGVLVGLGLMLTDLAIWQRLYMVEKKKLFSTFMLSAFIFLTVPLSLSSFFIVALANGGFEDLLNLWYKFIGILIESPILLLIFLLFVFSAITSTFGAILHAINSLLLKNVVNLSQKKGSSLFKFNSILSGTIGSFTLLISYILFELNVSFNFSFIISNLLASLVTPIIIILLSKRPVSNFIPFSIIISSLVGYILIQFVGISHSIWLTALSSNILLMFHYLLTRHLK